MFMPSEERCLGGLLFGVCCEAVPKPAGGASASGGATACWPAGAASTGVASGAGAAGSAASGSAAASGGYQYSTFWVAAGPASRAPPQASLAQADNTSASDALIFQAAAA